MFEHKVDDHTTYIICDPDTAAWYNIFWLIGAIIKLCIFVAAALFAPVLILPTIRRAAAWGRCSVRIPTSAFSALRRWSPLP